VKISFPLSLKVSLWLLLNLVALAVVGGGFLVTEAGFGWDMLVAAAPAAARLRNISRELTLELRQTPPTSEARGEMLARLGEEYGVRLYLFQNGDARQLAGSALELPSVVRPQLEGQFAGPPNSARDFGRGGGGRGGRGGRDFSGGPGPGFGPPGDGQPNLTIPGQNAGFGRGGAGPRTDPWRSGPDTPTTGRGGPTSPAVTGSGVTVTVAPVRGQSYGNFLRRSAVPSAYWIGVRLAPVYEPGSPVPRAPASTLLLRADSLWAAVGVLDLTPWLLAAAAAMGLSVVFWLPLVRGITRSVGELTRATERIAEGRFDTRVDEGRRDELGRLGGAVNLMAAQLDRAATGQKRFLGDIAHELGSPLGRLQVAVSILEDQAAPPLQPAVADVREEVQQMSALVGELLAFTKAGLRAREAELARIELAPLVAKVLVREAAEGRVTVAVPSGLAAQADSALLARALANLVRNALRYAGGAGPVTLTARAEGGDVVIAVEDHGPGVPPETLARLGEPFYRPEFARTRDTGGVGLGLAIVRGAAEACRGTVRFANCDPHGFRAELRLLTGN
jgi:two-component system sensor histidine kinase CpxA